MRNYKSIAWWPEEVTGLGTSDNSSFDWHDCPNEAHRVCDMLKQEGFGGERKIFPLKTAVRFVKDPV